MGTRRPGKKSRSTATHRPNTQPLSRGSTLLAEAHLLFRSGKSNEAKALYTQILLEDPSHFEANLHLGVLYLQDQDWSHAEPVLSRAAQANPDHPHVRHYLALALQECGRIDEALSLYEQELARRPASAELWYHAGNAYMVAGKVDKAQSCYREAIVRQPQFALAHHQWGELERLQGNINGAIDRYRNAIKADRKLLAPINNLAALLKALGRFDEAIPYLEQAMQLAPDAVEPRANLAICLAAVDRSSEALRLAAETAARAPESALAWESLAFVRQSRDECQEAAEALRHAVKLAPASADLRTSLGYLELQSGECTNAIDEFRQALLLDPGRRNAELGLAQAHEQLDDVADARECFRRFGGPDPLIRLRMACACPTVFGSEQEVDDYRGELEESLHACRESEVVATPEQLAELGIMPPFNLAFHGRDDLPIKRLFGETIAEMMGVGFGSAIIEADDRYPKRIGLVSMRNHRAFIRSLGGIIKRLPREEIEPVVIAPASARSALEPAIQEWNVSLLSLPGSVEQMADSIQSAAFDVLLYFEIGTTPAGYLLAHHRLAFEQCTTWGIQVTSGIPTVDRYLSSALIEPNGAQASYTEQLIRARTLLAWQSRPSMPAMLRSRSDFGLPENRHVYLCPQQIGKFTPSFDPLLAEILRQDPKGVLAITRGAVPTLTHRLVERWQRTMPDLLDRICWVPQQGGDSYWQLLRHADVFLDPICFGGVNTTYDALAMGKVIVTLPSPYQRGRYTVGCYQAMGITDGIATSPEDYVQRAVDFASSDERRTELERDILERSGVLFENQSAVTEFGNILFGLACHPGVGR